MAFEKVKKLVKQMDTARAKLAKDGQIALKDAFNEFFILVPEAAAIHFNGHTPSWNDGDICTFIMSEFNLIIYKKDLEVLLGKKMTKSEYDDGAMPYEGHQYDLSSASGPRATEICELFEDFQSEISDDDLFRQVFGESFQVKATPGKLKVEEYEGNY